MARKSRHRGHQPPPPVIDLEATEVTAPAAEPESVEAGSVDAAQVDAEPADAEPEGVEPAETIAPPPDLDEDRAHRFDAPPPETPSSAPAPAERPRWPAYAALAVAALALAGVAWQAWTASGVESAGRAGLTALEARFAQSDDEAASLARRVEALASETAAVKDRVTTLAQPGVEPDPATAQAVTGLEQRVAGLDGRADTLAADLAALRDAVAAAPAPPPDAASGEIVFRLDALAARLDALEARVPADLDDRLRPLAERIGAVEERLTALEARPPAAAAAPAPAAGALAASLAALRARLDEGAPFADELAGLAAAMPDLPSHPALSAHAAAGLAPTAELGRRLADIATGIEQSRAAPAPPPAGFWAGLQSRLDGVVKVRRAGEAAWPALIEGAARSLRGGGLDAAIAALETTPASPPQAVTDWLVQARARQAAETELAAVSAAVLHRIAQQGS